LWVKAAAKAGVKRFIPSEFGINSQKAYGWFLLYFTLLYYTY
jgi:hypothetical protein